MCFNKENDFCCCVITLLSALIGAIGIAAVFFGGLIASVTTLLVVTLILGILSLLFIVINSICGQTSCKQIKKFCLIPSSVGALVTSLFALFLTTLPTASIATAILVGAVAFFLILTLIELLNLLLDSFCKNRCDD